ncbi:DUF397 domain-containing protein [Streptomyces sp. NBC_01478]|uniref:DUF397 domain-containing protein n=1 Tax=Streptomyces sp. NBC_01478 TaxID=2903882 RepID=UPI002E301AD5|nr:DUF397 domain-containing protein [Streptomyces sp. NBC_01478]
MPHLAGQKSSYSTGGEGECVEPAAAATGAHIHLRESDQPHRRATLPPHTLTNSSMRPPLPRAK